MNNMEPEKLENKMIPHSLKARYMDVLKKDGIDIASLSLENQRDLLNSKYAEDLSTAKELNGNGSLSEQIKKCKKEIHLFWIGIVLHILFFSCWQSVGMSREKGERESITTTQALLCHRKGSRFHYSDSIMLQVPINGTYTFINDMSVPNGVSINDWDKETREVLYVKKFIELGGSSQGCVILSKTSTVVTFRKVTGPFYTKKLQITNVQMDNISVPLVQEADYYPLSKFSYFLFCLSVCFWSVSNWDSFNKLKQLAFFQSLLKIER